MKLKQELHTMNRVNHKDVFWRSDYEKNNVLTGI